ncbi:TRAP transporter small permease [uncultured Oscillibacter sp.]|uniref:TRAP transporter small permease n=1 Tax=uncultured Oscillibacter sp. TaxID=876091 RepID=UPI00280425F6|nr:TRAP transporter small permease [uncultured Oscillibacter sp.]
MKRFWKALDALVNLLLALGILGIAVICFAQIVARSIFGGSIMWSGEASRYLFVYVVFLASVALTRDNAFICMDLIQSNIPRRIRFYYDLLLRLLLMGYAAVLLVYGVQYAMQNVYQRSSSMHIPKHLLYMIMPTSGFLIILYSLRNIYHDILRKLGKEAVE